MLKIQFMDHRQSPFWVVEKLFSIGTAIDNHLVLADEGIDGIHARLVTSRDKVFLKDNNSRNGCFVNGQRITQKEILPGDHFKVGPVEFEVLDPRTGNQTQQQNNQALPWRLVSDTSWLGGKSFEIHQDHPVIIGRDLQCDIVIPGTHLARRHAEITVHDDRLRIRNIASSNGTFLNDRPIDEAIAHSGDRLRIDVYSFRLLGPEAEENRIRARASMESLRIPIQRKQPSTEPKRWKTRPTSPGNRIEVDQKRRQSEGWRWLALIIVVAAMMAGIYLL